MSFARRTAIAAAQVGAVTAAFTVAVVSLSGPAHADISRDVARIQAAAPTVEPEQASDPDGATSNVVHHRAVEIDGLEIFYREAGDPDAPTMLLLHGFPTSSHMFRDLIPKLAGRYHVVAPDYPGYGQSSMPTVDEFDYTFDNLADVIEGFVEAKGLDAYSLYLMDYGAPVGFRLATRHPDRVESFVIQNGNAYVEGLEEFWDPIRAYWNDKSEANADQLRSFLVEDVTKWQYTHGTRNPEVISPDTWTIDQAGLDRPGNKDIQLALFYDYRTNVPLYPEWQAWMREHQPPTLITWGRNDHIFPEAGARPYARDLDHVELHLLDTGHFALEEDGDLIARLMLDFLDRTVPRD